MQRTIMYRIIEREADSFVVTNDTFHYRLRYSTVELNEHSIQLYFSPTCNKPICIGSNESVNWYILTLDSWNHVYSPLSIIYDYTNPSSDWIIQRSSCSPCNSQQLLTIKFPSRSASTPTSTPLLRGTTTIIDANSLAISASIITVTIALFMLCLTAYLHRIFLSYWIKHAGSQHDGRGGYGVSYGCDENRQSGQEAQDRYHS